MNEHNWKAIAEANPPPPEWYDGDEERLWADERCEYWVRVVLWTPAVLLAVALGECLVQWVTR